MTKAFRFTLVWLAGSFIAILMSLNTLPASLVDGHYIPVGNDSFYHARRILDSVADADAFFEFDTRIHAPEGSQLPWPWAYDYVMAKAVSAWLALGSPLQPMTILAYLPLLAIPISIALIVGITRALNLSAYASLLAVLCVALSPLTQILHGIGIVDHHFAEYIFALAAIWSGLMWLNSPSSLVPALIAGCILGVSTGFHNGLFILQLPMLLTMAVLWSRGRRLPFDSVLAFAISLMGSTLLIALPSEPLQQGKFEFYLLSWFHVYIAACTASASLIMARLPNTHKGVLSIGAFLILASLPLARQVILGGTFVAGDLDMLKNIAEVKGIGAILQSRGLRWVIDYYSLLILIAPITLGACLWFASRRGTSAAESFFCISCVGGLALLIAQFRFHPYGSFALFLPLIAAADRAVILRPTKPLLAMGSLTLVLVLSYALPVKDRLFARQEPGNDPYYALTRSAYTELHNLCEKSPGLVLSGSDAGNYIRYHTECAVIANNFLLTPQHAAKIRELNNLLAMTPEQLLQSGLPIRYMLFTFADVSTAGQTAGSGMVISRPEDLTNARPRLVGSMLAAAPDSLGPRFRLLIDYKYGGKDGIPLARLYEILP